MKCKWTENETEKGLDETHQSACGKKEKQTCQTSLGLKTKKANKIMYLLSSDWTWDKITCLDSLYLLMNLIMVFMYAALKRHVDFYE